MQKYSQIVLRFGIGAVVIWFSLQQLTNPSEWVSFLPSWIDVFPFSAITFIYLNSWFELIFGILLIAGLYTRVTALLLALHMLGIIFSLGYNSIAVRDFGIFIALTSIFLHGPSDWSADQSLKRRKVNTSIS